MSLEFAGITMPQASTIEDIGILPLRSAEIGNSIALILPGNLLCSLLFNCAKRANGKTVKAARPCCSQVTWSSFLVVA
ncbi:Uncharacterised protein [Mycobacterium tuberculosis]|nr:Uncharacterised protein [Mycobacterium tuberculosis]